MKTTVKLLVFVLITVLAASLFASCGSSNDVAPDTDETRDTTVVTEDENVTGETKEWGNFSFLLPEGYEFRGGDVFDEEDTRCFSVKKSDFSYFDFQLESSEENMMNKYNYNKNLYTNGQADAEVTYNGVEWKGFEYDSWGTPCFEIYAEINGSFVRVSSAGFKLDGAVAAAVLESLELK